MSEGFIEQDVCCLLFNRAFTVFVDKFKFKIPMKATTKTSLIFALKVKRQNSYKRIKQKLGHQSMRGHNHCL